MTNDHKFLKKISTQFFLINRHDNKDLTFLGTSCSNTNDVGFPNHSWDKFIHKEITQIQPNFIKQMVRLNRFTRGELT